MAPRRTWDRLLAQVQTKSDAVHSVAGSPTCLAELRRAIRTSSAEAPGAIPSEVVDDLVLAVSEPATNAILYGSGDAQPVRVTLRVGGGWVEATIRDRGRPAAPGTAPLTSLRRRGLWLIGQLVDELRLAKARPGTLVTLRRRIGDPAVAGSPNAPAARQRVTAATMADPIAHAR